MVSTLEYWNLRVAPFEPVTDSRFYFASRGHEEAIARLRYLVEQESMYLGLLTGEIGCGKTISLHRFTETLDASHICVIHLENGGFAYADILHRILIEYGLGDDAQTASAFERYEMFRQCLNFTRDQHNHHLLLIIDEAQDMDDSTLTQVARLSNLNGNGRRLVTIVLCGQPELRTKVLSIPSLDQRISLRFHLRTLASGDIQPYLQHRLLTAGHPDGSLFSSNTEVLIHSVTRGVPRMINRLAKLALEQARADGATFIGLPHLQSVAEDLKHQQEPAYTAALT
jgi:general secretion pathway protein A